MTKIRLCKREDKKYIDDITQHTWEGGDYLSSVFEEWINDGYFYVAVEGERVIGTAKLTIIPEKTGWLEGLRVHPDYRGKSIGRLMNDFMVNKAKKLRDKGIIDLIEFSTYYKNIESLHMGEKSGFKIVERFYVLDRKRGEEIKEPKKTKLTLSDFVNYGDYIPSGWKFVKKTEEGINWLQRRARPFLAEKYKFYLTGEEPTFSILELSESSIDTYISYLNFLSKETENYELMIPEKWRSKISFLREKEFFFWEEPEEPNVYILRYYD